MSNPDAPRLDRRHLLGGVAVLGVAAPVLAACGSGKDQATASPGPAESGSSGAASQDQSPGASGGDGGELVATADVPVTGGVVLDADKVVVTQPAEGEFKAFTAICTHQGCVVATVADNTITCPCHGSQFSAEDGSVQNGPATAPLAAVDVQVKGGSVVRA